MIIYRCHVGPCTRRATSTLTGADHHGAALTIGSCGVHLSALTDHVRHRTGDAPVERSVTAPQDVHFHGRYEETRNMTVTAAPVVLRGPADADFYRVKQGRYGDRWYADPLPADSIAEATDESWPSVSTIKRASGSDWSFVALKRVAVELDTKPDALTGLDYATRYDRLKSINKLGLNRAAARGTQVHTYFEAGLRTGNLQQTTFDDPDGARYLPAISAFFDTYQPELVAAELVCINRTLGGYGYGGTADALIRIDGKTYLPDWKSRGDDSSHGAYPEEAAQLGGYSAADYIITEGPRRMALPPIDGGLIVSVKPDGCRIYPIDLDKARIHWGSLHDWWVARRDEREAVRKPWAPRSVPAAPDLAALIAIAGSATDLRALWVAHREAWNDQLTTAAVQRLGQLTGVST